MNIIEKFGLVFIIVAASAGRVGSNESGIVTYILFLLGLVAFLIGDMLLTKHALDGVPPQEAGDLTPADVHEKMWRLRQSRRK